MRTRPIVLLVLFALGMVACTGNAATTSPKTSPRDQRADAAPSDVLFLATDAGMQALDPSSGRVLFQAAGAVATPDWSTLVTSRHRDGVTTVNVLDPTTGTTEETRRLRGDLVTSAVSGDGFSIALVDPGAMTFPAVPPGRAVTHVVVVDAYGARSVSRFALKGNFQPEAFSSDASRLFMIEYLPAMAPDHYRVTWLDRATGRVRATFGRDKFPTGTMTGTRVMHVLAPGGDRLYTLYTNQPASSAEGYEGAGQDSTPGDPYGGGAARAGTWSVAFIHTLFLESGLAICVNLPDAFGSGPARAKTLAVSADGTRVFAIDAERDLVTVLRARGPHVAATTHVSLGAAGQATAVAATSPDGTLYVGWGRSIVAIDGTSLAVRQRWPMEARVTGLALGPDGHRLYVSLGNRIMALDPSTGEPTASIPTPGVQGISYVGSAD